MNSVNLIGRLTQEVELRYTTSAEPLAVARFCLAVPRQKKGETDFINAAAFGKQAETIANYVKKGQQLGVSGRWEAKQGQKDDGTKITYHTCIVEKITFVGSKAEGESPTPKKQKGYTLPDDKKNPDDFLSMDEDSEDLPF